MILILTLANKPALLLEALASVAAQTRRDYRHIVHLDHGDWPEDTYPPAAFFNAHAGQAGPSDYVAWLSDDDVWAPDYLTTLAGFLDEHCRVSACYGGSRFVTYDPQSGRHAAVREIPAVETYDVQRSPLGQIDGGQVLIRRCVLAAMDPPWVPEGLQACHVSDGTFLERVAALTPIVPVVGSWVMTNRMTPTSAHWRVVDGQPQFAAPETIERLRMRGASDG